MLKRVIISALIILCMFSLTSCGSNDGDTNNGASSQNEISTVYMKTPCSKDSVDQFMNLIGEMELGGLLSGMKLDKAHCYNVTPESVSAQTDYKIFKFSDSCVSLLLIDNKVYSICESFGGFGFVNAIPWDYDENGTPDLLVASSWGSGMHRSIISVFDATTKESITIFDTSRTDNPSIDLFVATSSPSDSMPEDMETPIYHEVCSARIEVTNEDYNLADLSYVATDILGSVIVENGKPVFKPTSK